MNRNSTTAEAPLVSVIMPVYNAAEFLGASINSVLTQTHANIELIIVNDGSVDESESIIHSFADVRIRYYFQENKGQCAASNAGLAKCNGEFIKFFDADDIMNSGHLEAQLKCLAEQPDGVASCSWGRFYEDDPESAIFENRPVNRDMLPLDWLKTSLATDNDMLGAWLWLIPANLIRESGGWDERLSLNNDFEFSIRLLLKSKMVFFTPDAKVYYRSSISTALSSSKSENMYEAAYLSTKLGCDMLLNAENSAEMRLICANRYQQWIFRIYPQFPGLARKMEKEIDLLGGSNITIKGSAFLNVLVFLLGWKYAQRVKLFIYRIGYKKAIG